MRESNSTFPAHNRAVVSITHLLYDRRALDTNSSHALLNNLTSLTYLTSTSPRIREILTVDGGLERLLDILRDSCLPHEPTVPDYWGLNGPCTARTINVDRAISLRHSLAFQCVVNIGVRGSESIRTRVVQAGALDIVAQILESWLKKHGIAIFSNPLGSQLAVDSVAAGVPIQAYDRRRHRSSGRHHHTHTHPHHTSAITPTASTNTTTAAAPNNASALTPPANGQPGQGGGQRQQGALTHLVASIANLAGGRFQRQTDNPRVTRTDTDVDMADAEADVETDGASIGPEDTSMDVDDAREVTVPVAGPSNPQATTPRAQQHMLPLPISIPTRSSSREPASQASSTGASLSSEEPAGLVRARSEHNLVTDVVEPIQRPASGLAARLPQLADDQASNQSSPMGTPNRIENVEGMRARRGTIIGRPVNINLMPRNDRRPIDTDASEASDAPQETDLATATIQAGLAAANAQAAQAIEVGGQLGAPNPPADEPAIVANVENGITPEDPDPEAFAAEQARLDLEAGAPPGQPGAVMQTPRVATNERATRMPGVAQPTEQPAQIIIANGAPRAFQDLASYVGISSLLHPEVDQYSDDSILLALQLLAYLSKYPHVRASFHQPRRPMHPTFNYGDEPLPERPPSSETPNIFSLVERYTFRPSPSDPMMFRIPAEIQYWAGVIMRNACRKDDAQGGIRQCANMSCGRWESFPREFAKCRRCRKAKYCSKECQSKAWSEGHRFWCNVRSDQEPGQGELGAGNPPPGGRRPRDADDDDDVDMDSPNGGGGGAPAGTRGNTALTGGGEGGAQRNTAGAQTRQHRHLPHHHHIPAQGVHDNTIAAAMAAAALAEHARTVAAVSRMLRTYGDTLGPAVPTEVADRPRPATPSPPASRSPASGASQLPGARALGSPAIVNRHAPMTRSRHVPSPPGSGGVPTWGPGSGLASSGIPAELERIMYLQRPPFVSSPLAGTPETAAPRVTAFTPMESNLDVEVEEEGEAAMQTPRPASADGVRDNNNTRDSASPFNYFPAPVVSAAEPVTPPAQSVEWARRRPSHENDDHDVPTTPPARTHAERHVRRASQNLRADGHGSAHDRAGTGSVSGEKNKSATELRNSNTAGENGPIASVSGAASLGR